jgi:hypothetical protein
MSSTASLVRSINDAIINPLILLLFAVALLVFLWGLVEYLAHVDDAAERSRGARHMLWGVVGMAVMAGAKGIIWFLVNTFHLESPPGL